MQIKFKLDQNNIKTDTYFLSIPLHVFIQGLRNNISIDNSVV